MLKMAKNPLKHITGVKMKVNEFGNTLNFEKEHPIIFKDEIIANIFLVLCYGN